RRAALAGAPGAAAGVGGIAGAPPATGAGPAGAVIGDRGGGAPWGPALPSPPPVGIAATGPGRLIVALLTGTGVLAAAMAAVGIGFVLLVASLRSGDAPSAPLLGGALLGLLLATGFVTVAAIVGQVVGLWDLRVEAVGDDLHLRHGLLE